jgi:hypothetical protein
MPLLFFAPNFSLVRYPSGRHNGQQRPVSTNPGIVQMLVGIKHCWIIEDPMLLIRLGLGQIACSHIFRTWVIVQPSGCHTCIHYVPIIRPLYGGNPCKSIPLFPVPMAVVGQRMLIICWLSNGCGVHLHQMLCYNCLLASVHEAANYQTVSSSTMAWNAHICASYKLPATKPVRKSLKLSSQILTWKVMMKNKLFTYWNLEIFL